MTQLRQNPLDFGVLDALRQHCESTRSYAVWAEALEHHARAASDAEADPVELGRLHFELGNLYRDQLGQSDRALVHYRTALDFDAAQRPAIAAARDLFKEAGAWSDVADLLAQEAESLPVGRKRAAMLVELAELQRDRLGAREDALGSLREAVDAAPDDLQVTHRLATMLLEDADRQPGHGTAKRREAADLLVQMARAVSDDYAFAYLESALDALPGHDGGLRLLEEVAPRMGRGDVLAPRWLAAIRGSDDAGLVRAMRLKMANAYIAVGQLNDARICLEPLIEAGDREAITLARGSLPAPALEGAGAPEEELLSSELQLDEEEAAPRRDSLADELEGLDALLDEGARDPLADLAMLDRGDRKQVDASEDLQSLLESQEAALEPAPESAKPVRAKSENGRKSKAPRSKSKAPQERTSSAPNGKRKSKAPARTSRTPEPLDTTTEFEPAPQPNEGSVMVLAPEELLEHVEASSEALDAELDAERASDAEPPTSDQRPSTKPRPSSVFEDEQASEPVVSNARPVIEERAPSPAPSRASSLPPPLPGRAASEPPAVPARAVSEPPPLPARTPSQVPEPVASEPPAQAPHDATAVAEQARREAAPVAEEPHAFQPPGMDEDADPFAEETQPRAAPLTLAELNALTGDNERNVIFAPQVEDANEGDIESEVTQITPAEDPQVTELRGLRTELARRLRFRDRRGAAEVAEALFSRGVYDAEAIQAMEDHYRLSRDFKRLRDLSEQLAGELSFGIEQRAARLREAVLLCESKLGDHEGAVRILRALLELEPDDAEAFAKLRSTLKRAQRWDELAALIDRHAALAGPAHVRAELYRELGMLQRDKRNDLARALDAYAAAHELDPGNADDAVVLSTLYAGAGRYTEAAAMYELRLNNAPVVEQPALLATLASIYEDKLHDDERAQHALERWRVLTPTKLEPLVALVRVLERRGEHRALVDALTSQLELVPPAHRGPLHARIAQVAFEKLGDAARAADSYGEAIVLAPQDAALWQRAAPAYERAGRSEELDELLWGIANSTRDRASATQLFDYIAETRAARDDLPGAIVAREAQYTSTQDVTALQALVDLLRGADRAHDLSRRLDELARRSAPEQARMLRLERADLLADDLREPEAAKAELERILHEISPDDVAALRKLVELCVATGDVKRRASAQERLVKLAPSLSARVELAVELVDIYEQELEDLPGAVRVLNAWTALEPENPKPYMRLLPLLAQTGKKRDLIAALDKLAELSISDEESGEFTLRASRVAMEIEDWDGAWNRLVPRVVEADDAVAERMLREVTKLAGRGEQLAALYVGLAQRAEDVEVEQKRWADAAHAFEQELGAHDRALEAMLRALAKQLDNRELLGEVERLSTRAKAWTRLGQVYDTIVRKADRTDARIELLMRHAQLLEKEAGDLPTAFERVWLAFQLDPANDTTYAEAKRLAIATGRREELLGSYERRTQSNAAREARLEALLDACALAQHELEDTARATGYLSRAVALAGDDADLLQEIEQRVLALDEAQPPVSGRGLVAELTGVYAQLAQENPRAPALASVWLARSARIHERELDDANAAYAALERASALAPGDETLLDELARVAALGKNWEPLAKHLQHAADVAIDSNSSSAALRRLGTLCERELKSSSRAADAYEQLVRLRPKDAEASRRLRQCLKAAERHDELLIAIDRELFVLKPEEGRRELLKEAAETWEFGLKNRYEALDAWKKVAAIAPADPDAVAALARLRTRPRADDSLLEEEVVVLPEDLRPSLIAAQNAAAAQSSLFAAAAASGETVGVSGGFLSGRTERRETVEPERVTNEDLSMLSGEFGAVDAPQSDEIAVGSRDFDADVTMPLDRERADEAPAVVSGDADRSREEGSFADSAGDAEDLSEDAPVSDDEPEDVSDDEHEQAAAALPSDDAHEAFSAGEVVAPADPVEASNAALAEAALDEEHEELELEEHDVDEEALTDPPPSLDSLSSMVSRSRPPSTPPALPPSMRVPPAPPRPRESDED